MTKKQKKMVIRLSLSAVFLAAGIVTEGRHPMDWVLFLISYLSAGYDIPLKALRNILNGQVFDENFLMTVATFGAIGVGEITSIPTAPAIADAYYRYDGKFRTALPLEDTPYTRK